MAKGYSQQEGIDFKETFSPVSIKDSLHIIKDVYMSQPIGFEEVSKEHVVCKLQKSIYGLKKAFRQWYLKFDEVVTSNSFKENIVDQCIYMKVSGSNYIFLVLYVDDILVATN